MYFKKLQKKAQSQVLNKNKGRSAARDPGDRREVFLYEGVGGGVGEQID